MRVKYGHCACVEVPIAKNGFVMMLLKLAYPKVNWVSSCPHWEMEDK